MINYVSVKTEFRDRKGGAAVQVCVHGLILSSAVPISSGPEWAAVLSEGLGYQCNCGPYNTHLLFFFFLCLAHCLSLSCVLPLSLSLSLTRT